MGTRNPSSRRTARTAAKVTQHTHTHTTTTTTMSSSHIYLSLSLLGLTCLAGAGVAVGSGVGMMTMQLMEQEAKKVAHSPRESARSFTVVPSSRGFAAAGAKKW